jgi:sugar transferase (PEP-CTERM/EpsH1 system associated)
MRILFITDYLPYPLISGDRIRVYNLIRRIANLHEVSLAAPLRAPEEVESVTHLQEFCYRVETGDLRRHSPLIHLPGIFRYAIKGKPLELKFLHSDELAKKISRLVSVENFDIIQIEPSRMALYTETLPPNRLSKRILVFHNIVSTQYNRIFQVERSPIRKMRAWLHSLRMQRWEPGYAEQFDRCIAVSEVDRSSLKAANPNLQIDVVPNGVDVKKYQLLDPEEIQQPPALLYIGTMSYAPCADAVLYFYKEIFPRVRQKMGEVQLWIVGANPPPEVTRLSGNGVYVTGRVEDVLPYYRRSAVCIVPLRAGGGTRLKILEAMALGRPVVSTTIGCEGLDVVDEQHILIADTAEQFAEKTIRLITDKTLYQQLIKEARELVKVKYDWDIITGRLLNIYDELTSQSDSRTRTH